MKNEIIKKALELSKIKSLNPMQHLAVKKGLLDGKNLVVVAPMASGKTYFDLFKIYFFVSNSLY